LHRGGAETTRKGDAPAATAPYVQATAHGVNVAISFRLDSNNIGNYNHRIWHDGIHRA